MWLWKNHRGCRLQAFLNVVAGLLQVGLGLIGVEALRRLTDIATGSRTGSLINMGAILIGVLLLELLINVFVTWIRAVLGVKSQNVMQRKFFVRLLSGKWNGVERFHSGDILNRLFGDVADIVSLMTEVLPSTIIVIVQFAASFIYLYTMDSAMALILICVSPIFLLLSRLYFKKMRRIVRKIKDSNSALQSIIQESVQHKMIVKVFEASGYMDSKLSSRQSVLRKEIKGRAKLSIYSKTLVSLGFTGGYLVALLWGLFQLQDGLITVGVLMAFTQLISRVQRPLLDMARLVPTFVNSLTSAERLMELEALPLEESDTAKSDTCEISLNENDAIGIRFNNVDYSYNEHSRKILENFSFDFKPGTFTSVCGETGRGKTTLMRLMLSLIIPDSGDISLYDSSGNSVKLQHPMRRLFSYVPQGNTLFSGTIRENLLFGNPKATEPQMRKALENAAADFVFNLPDGLDTRCGESGGGLSEGQAQRIAIARCLLRPCKIMLLDEATSALDSETEARLLANLRKCVPEKTIILITHRNTNDFQNQLLMK